MNRALKGWRRYTLVGPPLMMYSFGQGLTGYSMFFLIPLQRIKALEATSKEQRDEIEANYSYIAMYKPLVDYLIPAILVLFLGPWSDKYGRKPLLIAAYTASAIGFLFWGIASFIKLAHWWCLMASVPAALVGGYPSLILATYCYICDVTSDRERAWHFAWQTTIIFVGKIIGSYVSFPFHMIFRPAFVFGAASVCSAIAMLYVAMFVPESVIRDATQGASRCSFDPSVIRGVIKTCVTKRNGIDRAIVWCCIVSLAIFTLVNKAEQTIMFPFITARIAFVPGIKLYLIIVLILTLICPLFIVKIGQKFINKNMADIMIALIATIPLWMGSMVKSLSTEPWLFYLAAAFNIFDRVCGPVLWAILSKSVHSRDTGKVFGLAISVESLLPLASVPLYTMINENTMLHYPAPEFLISAGFYTIAIVLVAIIGWRMRGTIDRATVAIESDGAILRMMTPNPEG